MNRSIARLSLLLLCLLALGQSARASHCRHVDRLVMAQEGPSFWENAGQPAWEAAVDDTSASAWSSTCHKPQGAGASGFGHPIVGIESTGIRFIPQNTEPLAFFLPVSARFAFEPSPLVRPPRAICR